MFISKSPEERMSVIDSGASMLMLSKKDLSSGEIDTLLRSRTINGFSHIRAKQKLLRKLTGACKILGAD